MDASTSGAAGGMSAIDSSRPFRVGPWRVRPETNEIARDELVVRLEPKPMQLLVLLAGQAGRTVSRAAIVEALWDGRAVTDDAVNRQIAKLREALGDDPRQPVFVRTIPRTGLQLVAEVTQDGAAAQTRTPRAAGRSWIAFVLLGAVGLAAAVVAAWLVLRPAAPLRLGPETRLTFDVGSETRPALSPDGGRLAYVTGEPDKAVQVRALADPGPRRLSAVGTSATAPAWSPTGREIAFIQTAPACAVMIGSASAQTARAAWPCAGWSPARLAWRDDHRLIVSAARDEGPYQLIEVDLLTGGVRVLTHPPAGAMGDTLPIWNAARGLVYFVRQRENGPADGDVFSLDPASGALAQMTRAGGWYSAIAPGGPHGLTALATHGDPLFRIWRIDLDSGRWAPLSDNGDIIGLAGSADGRILAFGKSTASLAIVAADAMREGAELPLTTSTVIEWRPAFCGAQVSFLSARSGSIQVWAAPRQGEAPAVPISRTDGSLVEFACSVDGGLYAFGINSNGRYQLVLRNRRAGATDVIATAGQGLHSPAFSTVTNAIFYIRDAARGELVRHDLAANTETVVAQGVVRAIPDIDGMSLFLVLPDRRSLWRLDLASGRRTRIAEVPTRFAPLDVVIDGPQAWILGRPEPPRGAPLYRIDIATGAVTTPRRVPDVFGYNLGLAVEGGGTLIYPRVRALQVDLYRAPVTAAR